MSATVKAARAASENVYGNKPLNCYSTVQSYSGSEARLYEKQDGCDGPQFMLAYRGTQSFKDGLADIGIVSKMGGASIFRKAYRKGIGAVKTIGKVRRKLPSTFLLEKYLNERLRRSKRAAEDAIKEVTSRGYSKEDLIITGHSLGGYLADKIANLYNVRSFVFNRGGIGRAGSKTTAIRQKGDLVSLFTRGDKTKGKLELKPLKAHGITNETLAEG